MWAGETPRARWLFTARFSPDGESVGSFENFNMALHVGDDVQSVGRNRSSAASLIGSTAEAVIWPHLTHSSTALEIRSFDDDITAADILYTQNPNVTLATMSADCVPFIAIARNSSFILTAHIGWKGAALKIATSIERLLRLHTDGHVDLFLGPAICGTCYLVEKDRQEQVALALPESQVGEFGVDIRLGLQAFFINCGYNVQVIGPCTFEVPDLFSYRRNIRTGRQAALVRLT